MRPREITAPPEDESFWIPQSRRRLLLIGLASICLAAFGAFATLVLDQTNSVIDHVIGWSVTTLFGLAGAIGLWLGGSPRQQGLRLDEGGFTIVGPFASLRYDWRKVERFSLVRFGLANTLVGVDLNASADRPRLRRAGRALSGVDFLLPPNLRIKPEALLQLMQEWKRRSSS